MRRILLAFFVLLALPAPAHAIVGGTAAPAGTYDAVARVSINGSASCGGTLIAPTWVLSAGHCGSVTGGLLGTPIGWPPGSVVVTVGTTRTDGSGGQRIGVDRVVVSPS
ncbi:MAG TPA: trypsin-like serine protease, partial [Solirubrobacteraceae bacterium]